MKPVNLLPGDQRRRQSSGEGNGSAYVVVGLLGVLLLMVSAFVLTSNRVNSSKSQEAAAKAKADGLEAKAQSLGAFSTFSSIKETRLSSVRSVADSRFDWERMMRELSRVMPAGSWLVSVDASTTGVAGDNSTSSQTGAGSSTPAAELVGCVAHQSDTAEMMVRLRQLHRVDEVRLNQSSKGDSAAQTGSQGCGTRVQFDVTVSFSQTVPKEAPRGATRVPASLGGGS